MKQRITPQQLVSALSQSENITKKKAEAFLRAFFDVVETGLRADKTVKVKNFGTFKVTEVSERESVNIQTGERIQIDSHSKVSFTPDASLKEQVNKPFSQFQTVVLSDDVDEDLLAKEAAKLGLMAESQPEPVEPEPVAVSDPAPLVDVQTTPTEPVVAVEEPEAEVLPVADEPVESEDVAAEPADSEETAADHTYRLISEEDETNEPELNNEEYEYEDMKPIQSMSRLGIATTLIIAALCLIGTYVAGYYDVLHLNLPKKELTTQNKQEAKPVEAQKKDVQNPEPQTLTNEQKASKYEQIPNDEFIIIGELEPHVMKSGEGLYMLAKKVYGDKAFARHIIFFNQIKNPDNVPVGTTLRMPELRKKK
ncbi:MAG: HU family DNA-binding protein [Alloprevotella sp.]|nr:HU family DNA-binding protein [Alloprevotella sp.]